jgi:hypothetical protein
MPDATRMSEAEVAIRLAERFLMFPGAADHANVAIDGAVVEIAGRGRLFDIDAFLSANKWELTRQEGKRAWHGVYSRGDKQLHISSSSGTADVLLQLGNRRVVAECKGGPLIKRPGSPEHRILKEALGQALIWNGYADDLLIVAVPDTQWFRPLVTSWQQRPLVLKAGIQIALVAPTGAVSGFDFRDR